MSWQSDVADHLVHLKATSAVNFPEAWRLAMRAYPPRGRDAGESTPRLFEEDGRRPDTQVSFFRRVCGLAWEDYVGEPGSGNGPAIKFWRLDLLHELDYSEPARRSHGSRGGQGRIRQAA